MAERENLPIPENPDFNLEIGGLQPDDPVHFGQMNSILARLLTNEAFLEKLAGKMVEKALIAHVLDSANPSMVLGADQAPALTRLIDVERQRIGELYSDLAAKTIDGEVLDVIDAQPSGSTVTYTFSGAVSYNFALGIGIKLTNNTTAALLIDDDGSLVYSRKSGGNWRGWKTAITSSDLVISISKTANFDTYTKTGSGWLNGFNGGNTGNNNPAAIREGEGVFEVLAPAPNIVLQRWTINTMGIMARQKVGSGWDAWRFIPWA